MTENATARLLKPSHQAKADEPLQREHFEDALPEQRCVVHTVGLQRQALYAGISRQSVIGIAMRPVTRPRPGWAVEIKQDDEPDWRTFEIMSVEPNAMGFTELTVRSMG